MLDPIDVSRGNKGHLQVDYLARGSAPLRLTRIYNSNSSQSTAATTVPVGAGWRLFYDRSLQIISSTQIRLHRANGRVLDFTLQNGLWTSALPAGVLTYSGYGYQYLNHRDTLETYSGDGRLMSMTTAGLTTTLQYNGAGKLIGVTNPFGRSLALAYDTNGRVQTVTLPDGNTLGYLYGSNSNLVGVRFADKGYPLSSTVSEVLDTYPVLYDALAILGRGRTTLS